jgi:hypothetical protein
MVSAGGSDLLIRQDFPAFPFPTEETSGSEHQ